MKKIVSTDACDFAIKLISLSLGIWNIITAHAGPDTIRDSKVSIFAGNRSALAMIVRI